MATQPRYGLIGTWLSIAALGLAVLLMAALVAFGLWNTPRAYASPLAQPTASSIQLQWVAATGVLALTEQNAGAAGQLTVNIRQVSLNSFLDLALPSGVFFAATSTGAGGVLTYNAGTPQTSNVATIALTSATIAMLGLDLGSGSGSAITFDTVNLPAKIKAIDIKSSGVLTVTKMAASQMISANVGLIASGSPGTANVIVPTVQMSGTYGVGAAGKPLGTQVSIMETNAYTGSIYLANLGDLRIGISNTNGISKTNLYPGVQVLATTGNYVIDLQATGTISMPLISDTIKAPGMITVTADRFEGGCMIVGTNLDAIGSINGSVSLTTTGDILLGVYRNNLRYYSDITGKGVTLESVNGSIIIDYVTYITSLGGPLNIKAKNAVRVLKSGGYSGATFYTMDVTPINIEAPEFEMNSGGAIASSSAPMTITTDMATISATVRAPYYTLWLRPLTPGRPIDLGLGTTANAIGLNTTEVANLDASGGTVRIGGPDAGAIAVTAVITRAGTARLWLDSTSTITETKSTLAPLFNSIANNNLRFSSPNATLNYTNTAATTTQVDGLLKLNRVGGPALSGALVVGDGNGAPGSARVQLQQTTQFSTTPPLTVYGDGLFQLNGNQQSVGALTGGVLANGALSNTAGIDVSGGVLTTTHSTNTLFTGMISGTGKLVKNGLGWLTLRNDNTFANLDIRQGKVLITGTTPTTVTLQAGILGGTGAVGLTNALGGSIQPGLSPGVFTMTNLIMAAASELKLELNGLTSGTSYDQLRVTNGVTLTSPTLTIASTVTETVPADFVFTLIDNQGSRPINGSFAGLPEGATIIIGGTPLPLSYIGGDGNDLTLGTPGSALTLDLSKRVTPALAPPGQTITYTLAFTNTGTSLASGLNLTDTIPSALTSLSVASSVAITNTGVSPAYIWNIADLAAGASGVITVTGVVSPTAAKGVIVNTALLATGSVSATSSASLVIPCGATATVTSPADSGPGSLRQALADVCPGGFIDFNLSTPVTITLTSGELTVDKPVTITGLGADVLTVHGNNTSRVFAISASATVTMSELALAGGTAGVGGGINNDGTLTLTNVALHTNHATAGGSLYNNGHLIARGLAIADSTADTGAGLYNAGTATLETASFATNTALGNGGGLRNDGALTLRNASFYANQAAKGAGIYQGAGALGLTNVTLAGNQASNGGGVAVAAGSATMTNTLVANNTASSSGPDVEGTVSSGGHNLVGNGDGATGLVNGVGGNLIGTGAAPVLALLGVYGEYGGTKPGRLTLPLLPGSPAIDAGAACPADDQRAVTRPQPSGGACDIGAFEARDFTLSKTSGDTQTAWTNRSFAAPLVVGVSGSDPVNGGRVTFSAPASGASLNPVSGTASIINGSATYTPTANALTGSYGVTATLSSATPRSFTLTNRALAVVSVTVPANGTYLPGENLDFIVNWNDTASVTTTGGTPTLALTVGTTSRFATYLDGSGTTALRFRYTAQVGDYDLDGVLLASVLALNGGTLTNAVGQDAPLSLNNLGDTSHVKIAAVPVVTKVTVPASKVYTTGEALDFNMTWSAVVTVTGQPTITLTIGSATRVVTYTSGSGSSTTVFRYVVQAGDDDTDGVTLGGQITLNGGTIREAAGLVAQLALNNVADTSGVLVHTLGPQAVSMGVPADGSYRDGRLLDFTVDFDEPASLSGSGSNLALNQAALSTNSSCDSVTETPAQAVDGNTTTKWCSLVLTPSMQVELGQTTVISQIVIYHAGNGGTPDTDAMNTRDFTLDTSADGTTWQEFAVVTDNTARTTTHTNLSVAPARYVRLSIQVPTSTFPTDTATRIYDLQVFGTPGLALTLGNVAHAAAYVSGDGTAQHHFRYTVIPGDNDSDGIAVTGFITSGITLADSLGNASSAVSLPAVDTSGVLVDTTPPTITLVATTPASGVYGAGQHLDIRTVWSEPVIVTGSPTVTLIIGTTSREATYLAGSGSDTLTFRYTTQAGDDDTDGAEVVISAPLALNGGTLNDVAGNPAQLSFTDLNSTVQIDTTRPTITAVSAADALAKLGATVTFTVTWSEAVTVTGAPALTLDVSGQERTAVYQAGSGTATHVFRYTVLNGDLDVDAVGVTPTALVANGAVMQDRVGNQANLALPVLSVIARVDGVPPAAVTVTGPSGTISEGQAMTFVVTWTEEVTVSGSPYITVTIGSAERQAAYISGSGTTTLVFSYTVQADSGTVDLNNAIQLNGGTLQDQATNDGLTTLAGTFSGSFGVVDTTPPSVVALAPPSDDFYGLSRVLTFTLTWNEPITVTGTPRLPVDIGGVTWYATTAGGSEVTTLVFTYTTQVGDNAPGGIVIADTLDLNGGAIKDRGNNDAILALPAASTPGVMVDTTPPTLTLVTPATTGLYRVGGTLDWGTVWSEPIIVSGTPSATLALAPAVDAAYLAGSGTVTVTFRYGILLADNDTDGVTMSGFNLAAGTLRDRAGNAADLTGIGTFASGAIIDNLAPTVTTLAVAPGLYGLNQTVPFTVTWSEPVTVTGSTGLTITLTVGATTRYATYLDGSGTSTHRYRYTTQAGDVDSDGVAAAAVIDAGATLLRDRVGNSAELNLPALTGVATIDASPPTVTQVALTPALHGLGQTIALTVTWNRPVTVTGTPQIALTIGDLARAASYVSGSGTDTWVFRYVVQQGDNDSDGVSVGALSLGGGTISDAAGNSATLTLNGITGAVGVLVDTNPPTITSVQPHAPGLYRAPTVLSFVVNWNEPLTVTAETPYLELMIGGRVRQAPYTSGSGTQALTFTYTILGEDNAPSGIAVNALVTNTATLADGVGNVADPTIHNLGATSGISIDNLPPTVQRVAVPAVGDYLANRTLTFTVTWTEATTITSDGPPLLAFTIGSTPTLATYASGSGSTVYTFAYTTASPDLGAIQVTELQTNTAVLQDAAGNVAEPTLHSVADTSGVWVDTIPPQVTAASTPPGNYGLNSYLDFQVGWNEPVVVTGTPQLTVTVGTTPTLASYLFGSGGVTLTFRYAVQPGDLAPSGITVTDALLLNGGSIRDRTGNNAVLAPLSVTGAPDVRVDTIGPWVTNLAGPADALYSLGQTLTFTVTFNEAADQLSAQLPITVGTQLRYATYVTGTTKFTFAYVVQAEDEDADGIAVGPALTGVAQDSFDNAMQPALPALGLSGVRVDGIVPRATLITIERARYSVGQTLAFAIDWSRVVTVTGSPLLRFTADGKTFDAHYASGSGSATLIFTYTVQPGDYALPHIALDALLSLNGGTIRSQANAAALSITNLGDTTLVFVGDTAISGLSASGTNPTVLGQVTTLLATITAGDHVTYSWNFGDSASGGGGGASLEHTYAAVGVYTATVVAVNDTNPLTATVRINVIDQSVSGLVASSSSPTPLGTTTQLTATIQAGTHVTYTWDFGDGTSAILTDTGGLTTTTTTHTYPSVGDFSATVVAANSQSALVESVPVTVIAADLVLEKTVLAASAVSGDTITYRLLITNQGEVSASGVVITDSLPVAQITGVASSASAGVSVVNEANALYVWQLAALAPGASATITLTGRLAEYLAPGLIFTNTATVGTNSPERDDTNNTGSAVLLVECPTTYTVNTTADSGNGSLRQGIAHVCPGGTIDFNLTYPATLTLTSDQLTIDKDVNLNGPGAEHLAVSGNDAWRVFALNAGATVQIGGLTIRDGTGDTGGGIMNQGALTLTNSAVVSNTATLNGGGIANSDALTVIGSTVADNRTGNGGGGIYASQAATTTVANSTVSSNRASAGGGINSGGVLTITNSTLAANVGGGATTGAGLYNTGTLHVYNSIIANSSVGPDCTNDGGTIATNSATLIGDGACSSTLSGDPLLGALAPNGGTTMTHALLPGSPASDAGGACLSDDQRGVTRPQGAACDLGAYEGRGFTLSINGGTPQSTRVANPFATPLQLTLSETGGGPLGPGAVVTFTPPATGAGLNVTTPFTRTTDAAGVIRTTVTANEIVGSYSITATVSGVVTPVSFTLTNTPLVPVLVALAVGRDGTGSGTVSSAPTGINCGLTCIASFDYGTTVTLTATADVGSTFTGWQGAGSGGATYTRTLTATQAVTATFTLNQYTIAVSADPAAGGSVAGGGSFRHGSTVSVTATANVGYRFVNWSEGGSEVAPSVGYRFTATGNRALVAHFGFAAVTTVGDLVWLDLNGNGVYDAASEAGVPDVSVDLLSGTTVVRTTTTRTGAQAGLYAFEGLTPGTYSVRFTAPTGYTFTNNGLGSLATDGDNDARSDGTTARFTLSGGQQLFRVDAGLRGMGGVTGIVWEDTNRNNVRDDTELGRFAGVQVALSVTPTVTPNQSHVVTATTATDGSYRFGDLPYGTATISFTTPAKYTPVTANIGDDAFDSDGPVVSVTLTADVPVANVDMGYRSQGSRVFLPQINGRIARAELSGRFTVTPTSPQSYMPAQVTVTVTNTGEAAATNFWVDLYLNPSQVPTINTRWNDICGPTLSPCLGIAWYYTGVLQPGQSVTLISTATSERDPNGYKRDASTWLGYFLDGTSKLYVLVDSWNRDASGTVANPNGAVDEQNEQNNLIEQNLTVTAGTPLRVNADLLHQPLSDRPRSR